MTTTYLSNSEASTFKRCRRKWWLAWYLGLSPVHVNHLGARARGSRVHRALAMYYVPEGQVAVDPREALERVLAEDAPSVEGVDPQLAAAYLETWQKGVDLERAMVEGYVEWLEQAGADEDLEVLAPERALFAELLPDLFLMGRVDVDVRLRSRPELRLQMDHKTTGNFSELFDGLDQDEQLLTYLLLLRSNLEPDQWVHGALYNALRKVKRTARANPPFYDRRVIRFNDHQVHSFTERLVHLASDMAELRRRLDDAHSIRAQAQIAYPTPNHDCRWSCDFRHVCPLFDDGSRAEDMLAGQYVAQPVTVRYPELEAASA